MRPTRLLPRSGLAGLLLALAVPAAAQVRPATRAPLFGAGAAVPVTALAPQPIPLDSLQRERVAKNCPAGAPRLDSAAGFGFTRVVARQGYALEHSSQDKIALWVCEGIASEQLVGEVTRDEGSANFPPDTALPPGLRAERADYEKTGFDRGHMAPAGDQNSDPRLKAETFFLSNMAPQAPDLNRKVWRVLEDTVRQWLVRRGSGFVVTGGFFYDPLEDDPATADGVVDYQVIGRRRVAVPTHFYKIVAAPDGRGGWDVIAFVLANRGYPKPWLFQDFVVPVDWIEARTGIDFFPELEAELQARLEAALPAVWR
ncbi:MAG TPA: DNA/RNA non-specific endonuclease [Longimicrobium sp.]|jgi:endonuclease G